jgi:hypothetical protein
MGSFKSLSKNNSILRLHNYSPRDRLHQPPHHRGGTSTKESPMKVLALLILASLTFAIAGCHASGGVNDDTDHHAHMDVDTH